MPMSLAALSLAGRVHRAGAAAMFGILIAAVYWALMFVAETAAIHSKHWFMVLPWLPNVVILAIACALLRTTSLTGKRNVIVQ